MAEIYDETTLTEQLQNHDKSREAFGHVVRAYAPRLYAYVRRMVISHDDTDDILQNVFLKAWTNLHCFRGDARLSTWLYKIAINETMTFLARQRRQANITADSQSALLANAVADDTWFDGDKAQMLLRKAIASLPEKQRTVFTLRYFREMKYDDMSEILGTTVGALKASYHLAAKKIEKYITENS